MMTRKQFNALAKIYKESWDRIQELPKEGGYRDYAIAEYIHTLISIIKFLRTQNTMFNTSRFVNACGIKYSQIEQYF